MPRGTRPFHQLLRVSKGEEVHPSDYAGTAEAIEGQRADGELLELRSAHQLEFRFGVSVLPFTHHHAGHAAPAGNADTTQTSRRSQTRRSRPDEDAIDDDAGRGGNRI